MMDSLEQAQGHIEKADEYRNEADISEEDERRHYHGKADLEQRRAIAYAQIAQAEQLKRIGDSLERLANTNGVTAEVYEAAERGLRLQEENRRLNQRISQLEGEPNETGY